MLHVRSHTCDPVRVVIRPSIPRLSRLRILVVSNLYPPFVRGGYEMECAGVVERLRLAHDVVVLTSRARGARLGPDSDVHRVLPFHPPGKIARIVGPFTAAGAARIGREMLDTIRPDLIFIWNGS